MPEQDIFENEVEVTSDIPQVVEARQYTSSITIGDVTTLPAGSEATVTNTGTEENAILNFGLPKGDAGSMWGELAGDIADQTDLNTLLTGLRTDVDLKAPLASPALTGTPTAPTAVDDTNTTQIATTAFVKNAITNLQNSLQSYINTKVANMLKIMNFSGSVDFSLNPTAANTSASYTAPADGYFVFKSVIITPGTSATTLLYVDGHVVNSNTAVCLAAGVPYPISSGTVITAWNRGNAGKATALGVFVPFAS